MFNLALLYSLYIFVFTSHSYHTFRDIHKSLSLSAFHKNDGGPEEERKTEEKVEIALERTWRQKE